MRIAGRALASALQLNPSPHIALSAVAAAATLLRFLQWKRLGASHLEAVWRFYGVFIFAYFFGSVCGLAYCSTQAAWFLYLAGCQQTFFKLTRQASRKQTAAGAAPSLACMNCAFYAGHQVFQGVCACACWYGQCDTELLVLVFSIA